jgi:hypothetical protein
VKQLPAAITIALSAAIVLSVFVQASSQILQNQTKELSVGEKSLVQSSRTAILDTGISAAYFDRHFKLVRVIDTASDRRVIWKYSIGEYAAILNDAVGFYSNDKGKRINIHAVRGILSTAHDIKNTIPKKRAEQLMLQCIGKYTLGAVVFQSFGTTPRASLLLTASSIPKPRKEKREEERKKSRKNRDVEKTPAPYEGKSPFDTVEEGDDDDNGPLIYTGFIDLETGMCTKGVAQADHPVPLKR